MQAKIKKFTSLFLVLMLVIGVVTAMPITASATETDGEGGDSGFQYEMDYYNEGSIIITGYNGSETDLVIPGSIDGYTVTGIGYWAFSENYKLKSIVIPDSVTSIYDSAFASCINLTSVTIPNSISYVGGWAFLDTAWYDNQPDGLIYIGKSAYKYKGEMSENTEIVLKDGTSGISGGAFYECARLTSITIPDSVVYIGSSAFSDCTGLTSITIPNSVRSIDNYAFSDCTGLTSVIISNSVANISDGVFARCTGLTSIIIPDSVTNIIDGAFSGCTGLTSITIPGSVTNIGSYAFSDCTGLTSVTIPDSVTNISNGVFSGCTGLTEINVSENNSEYSSVDGAVLSKDKSVFIMCPPGKNEYTIPDSVKRIDTWAFSDCAALTNITVSDSVISIGSRVFEDTAWYDNQPDGLVYAGKVAYGYKGEMPENTEIVLKDGTLGIAESTFYGCTGLTSITIPDSVTNIGESAFSDCTGLTSITIPDSVTNIGESAFSDCTGLTSITIPDSVTSIGTCAFYGCTGLTGVTIPDSVTYIGESAFYDCTALTDINVSENNQVYSSVDGALLNKQKTELLFCPVSKKEYTIPDGVRNIARAAFSGCSGLQSLTIPDSVIKIGSSAFSWCSALTSIKIPDGVVSIDTWVFLGCNALTSVTIPESVTSIGYEAFCACSSLSEITIPDSVTTIDSAAFTYTAWYDNQPEGVVYAGKVAYAYKGEMPENTKIVLKDGTLGIAGRAFSWNENLTDITIPDSVISVGNRALDGTAWYEKQPNGVVYAGKVAYGYKGQMTDNTEIDFKDGTLGFADSAFINSKGLTSVTIPDSVTSIAYRAFGKCTDLASVKIPKSVKSIGDYAFYDCDDLTSVTIPQSVTSIGEYALGYGKDRETWSPKKLENFTISGYTGTASEQYAKDNGFEFIALEPAVVSGDASGDGVVDAKDRMLLSRYLAKWKGYENIDVKAADVNQDGEVNAKDRMILARHLAKWKGYETLPFDK